MAEDLFKIEDAKPEDVKILLTIVRDAWMELYPNETYGITAHDIAGIDWFDEKGLERRRKEITEKSDKVHTWVLKNEEKKIVGYCKVLKLNDCGEIDAMFIIPAFQRKGLGKKLIKEAFEWLGSKSDIILKVVKYNLRAIEFYKKMGFKETTNEVIFDEPKLPSGIEIPRIEMIRKATAKL